MTMIAFPGGMQPHDRTRINVDFATGDRKPI